MVGCEYVLYISFFCHFFPLNLTFPIIDNETNHLLFSLVINESVVLNVGGATVLIRLLRFGKILHGLLHSDVSDSTAAVWPGRKETQTR